MDLLSKYNRGSIIGLVFSYSAYQGINWLLGNPISLLPGMGGTLTIGACTVLSGWANTNFQYNPIKSYIVEWSEDASGKTFSMFADRNTMFKEVFGFEGSRRY